MSALDEAVSEKLLAIEPQKMRSSDEYRKKILKFQSELEDWQLSLRKETYYYYKTGLTAAQKRIHHVQEQFSMHSHTRDKLLDVAKAFDYPGLGLHYTKLLTSAVKRLFSFRKTIFGSALDVEDDFEVRFRY